jgi:hypothetical protein
LQKLPTLLLQNQQKDKKRKKKRKEKGFGISIESDLSKEKKQVKATKRIAKVRQPLVHHSTKRISN